MCRCGRKNCTGFVLLHNKELDKIPEIKARELKENPNYTFDLKVSEPSGEMFTKFYELHVLAKEENNNE